jgi:multiple sugar transport system permease protein
MTGLDPTVARVARTSSAATSTEPKSLASSRRQSRIAHYVVSRGWVHLVLITFIALFLFPFAYMVATSLKTDEELHHATWLPAIPRFEPTSPRIRESEPALKPAEAPSDRWEAALPKLRQLTREAVDRGMLPPGGNAVDLEKYRATATEYLINQIVPRLNQELWVGETSKLLEAYKLALLPKEVDDALNDRLARFELRGLQARSLDAHIYIVTAGEDVAATWKIESGEAHFEKQKESTLLRYHFGSSSDEPIVLSCAFDYPADPQRLHKLMFAVRPDDSWNQVDATLDFAGRHWVSAKTKYLGTSRPESILFQPPSFDDTTDRKRIWVPIGAQSELPAGADPKHGVLRITITPSSTLGAIWGKVRRNYDRVFESIPFWRYVANSLTIVLLATAGTLLSSSFVAYAFARLNWPGRTVAFALLLSTMMLPAQVTMIPSFMIWRAVGWYNTLTPLWLPAWFGVAFFIFLMVQHMRTIPRELEEAARIDGASPVRTWAQIILPQTKPALAAIAIMVFMASWNDFMGPLIYLRDQAKFPLSLGLYAVRLDTPEGGTDWTLIMAGNVLMTAPVVAVFFLFQRYFIQGMTMSGMKG